MSTLKGLGAWSFRSLTKKNYHGLVKKNFRSF